MHEKAQLYGNKCKSLSLILCFYYSVIGTAFVTVNFDLPVISEGDNVEMTCTYTTDSRFEGISVYWQRQTENEAEIGTWLYYEGKISGGIRKEFQIPTTKFEYINATFHDEGLSHKIRLLQANQSDEGLYWCFVKLVGVVISPKIQLDLGEWCEHLYMLFVYYILLILLYICIEVNRWIDRYEDKYEDK